MAEKVHIWVDADSCPTLVRNHVVKMGNQLSLSVTFVANKNIPCSENSNYEMIICNQEKDAADNYIFDNVSLYDLVITRDIVFADRLVTKGVTAINDRGTLFNKDNIKELLAERDFDMQFVEMGLSKHHSSGGYDKKNFSKFASCFDKNIHSLIRQAAIIKKV